MAARSPFWNRTRKPPPAPPRPWRARRWAARAFGTVALAAALLGLLGIPFPRDESVEYEVILLADTRTARDDEAAHELERGLRDKPGVANVTVRTGVGPRELVRELDA